jgi:hypothetical protein
MIRSALLRCYPARWRARYGDEFASVLEERPLGPFDVADVLLGAIDAHLHLRGLGAASEHRKGFPMSLRIGGFAALFGGLFWFIALAGSSATDADGLFAGLAVFATLSLLVAMAGLSAFQARRYPRVTWVAFGLPAIGAVISLIGMYGMFAVGDAPLVGTLSPWWIWMGGTLLMVVGSGLFALVTWQAHSLSRSASMLLGGAAIATLVLLPTLAGTMSFLPEAVASVASVIVLLGFAAGWAGLGVSALRLDRRGMATSPGAALS